MPAPRPRLAMKTWALANQKGGTGKTTVAINLAAALAEEGKRCLLIDLDPQAHATLGLGVGVEKGRSIARTFLDGAPLADLLRTVPAGFHLVPADGRLAEFEQVAERSLHPEHVLTRALAELGPGYDWVLLDCPPRADGVLCANAIRASQTVCLVVETGAFALQGALRARRILASFAGDLDRLPDLRLLATLYDRRERLARDFLVALQARFGPSMLDTVIRRDPHVREAAAFGIPVRELHPDALAGQDFLALARELLAPARSSPPTSPDVVLSSSPAASFSAD